MKKYFALAALASGLTIYAANCHDGFVEDGTLERVNHGRITREQDIRRIAWPAFVVSAAGLGVSAVLGGGKKGPSPGR